MRRLPLLASLAILTACNGADDSTRKDAEDDLAAPFPVEVTDPITGGTLALSPDGSLAAASDIGGDQIHLIDVASATEIGTVRLKPDTRPARLLVDDNGLALVTLRGPGAVATFDLTTGTELSRHEVCPSPRGLTRDGDAAWLACASGELVQLDATTGAVRSSTWIDLDLRDVVVDGDQLLVSTFKRAELLTVTRDGQLTDRRSPPLFTITSSTFGQVRFSPGAAWRTIADPSGGAVMFYQRGLDSEIPIPTGPRNTYYGQDLIDGDPRPGCGGIAHSGSARFPSEGPPSATGILANTQLPVDGTVLSTGDIAVAAAGANPAILTSANVQVHPQSAFGVPDGDCTEPTSGTHLTDDSLITAVAATPDDRLIAVGRSPFAVFVDATPVALTAPEVDDPEKQAFQDRGFELFHRDASTGMTCASCHMEGQEDGRVWVFADVGERRTQSMSGGLAATAPFHWGAEFENMSALMDEVLVNRMGLASYETEDVQALVFFMEGLQPVAITPQGDADAIARGEAIFHDPDVACAGCHGGPLYTANVSADVGTGGLFQVPSLLGVGYRFPFLHDGCAETLEDRFTPACDDGSHGNTAGLGPDEIDALVAYLQTL